MAQFLPSRLPEPCIWVLGRPGWFAPTLLRAVRLQPATPFVRLISSQLFTETDITATTLDNTIYFRAPERFDIQTPTGLALLAHELRHVEQYREQGGMVRFAILYLWEYLRRGYGTGISFEANAFEVGRIVQQHLAAEFAFNVGVLPFEVTTAGYRLNPRYRFLHPCPPLPRWA